MRIAAACMVLALSMLSSTASAQQELRSACEGDYRRLCSAFQPGTAEVEKCFRDNIRQVSETCRAAIRASRAYKTKLN